MNLPSPYVVGTILTNVKALSVLSGGAVDPTPRTALKIHVWLRHPGSFRTERNIRDPRAVYRGINSTTTAPAIRCNSWYQFWL